MPLYEYQCEACGRRFEIIQKFSDPPAETCRTCGGGPVQRLVSSPAIQFKGTGWYITDYSQKGKPPGESAGEKSDKSAPGEKKDGASGSDKQTTSTESKSTSSSDGSSSSGDSGSKPSTSSASGSGT